MPSYDFDLFTIGAGSGGVAASRRAGSYGARVAICEESRTGGTCVIRGCVPKKLLVYGSSFADAFADAPGFGWERVRPRFDWAKLIRAKDAEIARLEGVYKNLLESSGVTRIEGRGRLVDRHTVEVAGRRYTAAHVLIATGAHPVVPAIPGIEAAITSNEALDLEALPRRIIIVGGGYIAVEFAGIFASLGSEVTLVIRGEELLNGFDDDVRATLALEMRGRGVEIRARTEIVRIEKGPGGITATTRLGEELGADIILYATGRRPNTRGIGLEEVGVRLTETGAVDVDEWSRTSVPNIWAVGDVTNRLNLTPVAIAEGRALVETLFNDNPMKPDHTNVPTAVFSQPPVGAVGLTERQARAAYGAIDVYRTRFKPMRNTLAGREERTMMKLIVDRATDRVLGCHMVGADAPEIIQGFAVALKCGATKRQFDQTIGIHPTAAEEFVTMREKVPEPAEAAD
ncbi:MAG: glutathione-disulfide reductase [Rhodospirillales bacterium]|nr:glutathione-disulfide reductase [Rhodospirillales bacterium]